MKTSARNQECQAKITNKFRSNARTDCRNQVSQIGLRKKKVSNLCGTAQAKHARLKLMNRSSGSTNYHKDGLKQKILWSLRKWSASSQECQGKSTNKIKTKAQTKCRNQPPIESYPLVSSQSSLSLNTHGNESVSSVAATKNNEFLLEILGLLDLADASDEAQQFDLAIKQYQAIRERISSIPFDGGLAAIDAKSAFSMGMIYEQEKRELSKALALYNTALRFYSTACAHIKVNNDISESKKMNIQNGLNDRICAILFRIACVRGKQFKWKESLEKSQEALEVFHDLVESGAYLEDKIQLEKRIKEQIELSTLMLVDDYNHPRGNFCGASSLNESQRSYRSLMYLADPAGDFSESYRAFMDKFQWCTGSSS